MSAVKKICHVRAEAGGGDRPSLRSRLSSRSFSYTSSPLEAYSRRHVQRERPAQSLLPSDTATPKERHRQRRERPFTHTKRPWWRDQGWLLPILANLILDVSSNPRMSGRNALVSIGIRSGGGNLRHGTAPASTVTPDSRNAIGCKPSRGPPPPGSSEHPASTATAKHESSLLAPNSPGTTTEPNARARLRRGNTHQPGVGTDRDDRGGGPHQLPRPDILCSPRERPLVLVHDARRVNADLNVVRYVRQQLRRGRTRVSTRGRGRGGREDGDGGAGGR